MEATTITVYIDNKPYRFHVDIDYKDEKTTYKVSAADEPGNDPDFIPDELHYNEDGSLELEERTRSVEQAQIARLIWQEIIDKLKP